MPNQRRFNSEIYQAKQREKKIKTIIKDYNRDSDGGGLACPSGEQLKFFANINLYRKADNPDACVVETAFNICNGTLDIYQNPVLGCEKQLVRANQTASCQPNVPNSRQEFISECLNNPKYYGDSLNILTLAGLKYLRSIGQNKAAKELLAWHKKEVAPHLTSLDACNQSFSMASCAKIPPASYWSALKIGIAAGSLFAACLVGFTISYIYQVIKNKINAKKSQDVESDTNSEENRNLWGATK